MTWQDDVWVAFDATPLRPIVSILDDGTIDHWASDRVSRRLCDLLGLPVVLIGRPWLDPDSNPMPRLRWRSWLR